MSRNLIHSLFLKKRNKTKEVKEIKQNKKQQRDDVNKINISAKDFYRKMNQNTSKKLAWNYLYKIVQNPVILRKKIHKKKFLLGSYLKQKSKNIDSVKKRSDEKYRSLKEFKNTQNLIYQNFKELNQKWEDYILDLIMNDQGKGILAKISRSDFHGAFVEIIDSTNRYNIGLKGIILQESLNSFILITSKNEVKSVVKKENVFRLFLREKRIKIYGCLLTKRIEERFKQKYSFNYLYKISKKLIKLN